VPGSEPSRQPALRYGPAQLVEADVESQPLPRPGCGGRRDGPVHQIVVDDEDVEWLRQIDAAEVEPEPVARQPQLVDLFPGAEQQRRVSGELVVREVHAVEMRGTEGGRAGIGPVSRLPTTLRSSTVSVGGMVPESRFPSRRT
jgi:hypothetical protein